MLTVTVVVPPASEPVSVEEARAHLRVDATEDGLLAALIPAARERLEQYLRRALARQTLRAVWDVPRVPAGGLSPVAAKEQVLEIPYPPLVSVSRVAVEAKAGTWEDLDPAQYVLQAEFFPARLAPASGSWAGNRVLVEYQAGHETLPPALRRGLLMLVAHLYEHRGDEQGAEPDLPGSVRAVVSPWRVVRL